MLIVSKFHDYYDSAAMNGVDKSVVYNRNPVISALNYKHEFSIQYTGYRNLEYEIVPFLIGFCGKIFVGFQLFKIKLGYKIELLDTTYDLDMITRRISEMAGNIKPWHLSRINDVYHRFNDSDKYFKYFLEYNAPIFYAGTVKTDNVYEYKIIVNPCLKNFRFYVIKNVWAAFQEIQQFISESLLMNKKENPVSDEIKIISHGFDKKWSFRKPPEL